MPEAAALLDAPHARTEQEMLEQGRSLLAMGCGAVLMKGGHLDDEQSPDWLFTREGEQRFTAPRIMTKNTHGTGCTLSAALAALRPRHTNWADTVQEAKSWLSSALARPTRWKLVTVLVRFTTSTPGGEHRTIAALVIVSLWR